MFTGIVETVGQIATAERKGSGTDSDLHIRIACPGLDGASLSPGDSVSVAGVCLTATAVGDGGFWADVSAETLACTTLGDAEPGTHVNLETTLRLDERLGGHLVSGHVDGVGTVRERHDDARSVRVRVGYPAPLGRYIAAKGSICIDGVSLTVNDVTDHDFGVNLVPHTVAVTTFSRLAPGQSVNLEVDLLARYLERMLADRGVGAGGGENDP